jgi:hypothetical protein
MTSVLLLNETVYKFYSVQRLEVLRLLQRHPEYFRRHSFPNLSSAPKGSRVAECL